MRLFHLHSLGRNFPHRFFKIKLTPKGTSKFAGANSLNDQQASGENEQSNNTKSFEED